MTVRVDFYVLSRREMADKYHYACRIANKAHDRGLKVYLQTDGPQQSNLLDKLLWTFSQGSFVPHSVCDAPGQADDAERYPVQIGHGNAPPDCADLLISLCRAVPADYARFNRIAELIIDQAADKASGRERFNFYRGQGIHPNTHEIP